MPKINMEKYTELQEKIKAWEKKTKKWLEDCELNLTRMDQSMSLVKSKFSSVLKSDKATSLSNWMQEGELHVQRLQDWIKKSKTQLNCKHPSIDEDVYKGHDSHYDYYFELLFGKRETKCSEYGAVFDDYKH